MTLALLGQLLGIAAASGTRATLTLLAVIVVARIGGGTVPDGLSFLTTNVGLAVLVAVVVLDELVDRDPELQELVTMGNIGVRGAAGAASAWGVESLADGFLPDVVTWILGAAIAIAVHLVRVRILSYLPEGHSGVGPRTWVAWLEAGGVLGLIVAVFVAPVLALGVVLLGTVITVAGVLIARRLERSRHRRACPHCGTWARNEASRCPKCRNPIPVSAHP
ncbi:MAG: DUF4126 domain-containing protein [Nannocystales bacterium]